MPVGDTESLLNHPIGSGQTLCPCTQHLERYIVCTDIVDGLQLRSWLAHHLPSELEILGPAGFPEHAA